MHRGVAAGSESRGHTARSQTSCALKSPVVAPLRPRCPRGTQSRRPHALPFRWCTDGPYTKTVYSSDLIISPPLLSGLRPPQLQRHAT